MTRLHAATALVCASVAYLALSLVNREAAVNIVLGYIAAAVTLLVLAQLSKERRRGR